MRRALPNLLIFCLLPIAVAAAGKPDRKATQALLQAAEQGDVVAIAAALKQGAELDGGDAQGNSALQRAAASGRPAAVKRLLEAGAGVAHRNAAQADALMLAAQQGDPATIAALLERNADVHAVDRKGRTALMFAAREGKTAAARALIAKGADVSARDEDGRTALHFAAAEGQLEVVRVLLAAKADPAAANNDGDTPRTLAEAAGHADVAGLLPRGAAVAARKSPPPAPAGAAAKPVAAPPPSGVAAGAPDHASGTLTVAGKTVKLTHAYLLPDTGTPPAVLLFLTDVPVEQAVLSGGHFDIGKLSDAGALHLVRIRITLADKVATSSEIYDSGFHGGHTGVVGAGDFKPTSVSSSLVEGKVSMATPREVPEGTYQYSATFRASFGQAAGKASAATAAVSAGRASGSMTVDGTTTQLGYAFAWVDTTDAKKPVVLLLADRDVPASARRDTSALGRMARGGQLSAVCLYFDAQQEIFRGELYHAAFDGSMSASGMHVLEKVTFDSQVAEGRVYTRGEQSFFKHRWSYSAAFKAMVGR